MFPCSFGRCFQAYDSLPLTIPWFHQSSLKWSFSGDNEAQDKRLLNCLAQCPRDQRAIVPVYTACTWLFSHEILCSVDGQGSTPGCSDHLAFFLQAEYRHNSTFMNLDNLPRATLETNRT